MRLPRRPRRQPAQAGGRSTAARVMLLVDTSVWVEHFRRGETALADSLRHGAVLMHPFIAGELACGNLKKRRAVLADLHAVPPARLASNQEVRQLIEARRLWGRGLGWIDAHLLASALLSGCRLWTLDRRLRGAAAELGLSGAGILPLRL